MTGRLHLLASLAWRNIWRQPQRTALSFISIAFACVVTIFVLALQQGSYNTMKESVLRLFDGFAQIQPPGYADDPDIRRTIADPRALAESTDRLSTVSVSTPRASAFVIVSHGARSYGAAAMGVAPASEAKVSVLAKTIAKGRYITPEDSNAVVVGQALARNLKISVGSTLTMLGGAYDGSVAADVLTVVGIFDSGAPELDRQVIQMPLKRFQEDFALGGRANLIAFTGRHLAEFQTGLPALHRIAGEAGLVLRDWTELQPAVYEHILLDVGFSSLLYASLIAVVVFIILNTILMSVLERTREFGMLLALGMRPTQIGRMVWLEILFLTGIGVTSGLAVGTAVTYWVSRVGIVFSGFETLMRQWNMPSTFYPQLNLISVLTGPLVIAGAIAIAGLVPYVHVRRLNPVTAMRAA